MPGVLGQSPDCAAVSSGSRQYEEGWSLLGKSACESGPTSSEGGIEKCQGCWGKAQDCAAMSSGPRQCEEGWPRPLMNLRPRSRLTFSFFCRSRNM